MTIAPTATPAIRSYADIEGWFFWDDRALFDLLLESQPAPGALVELGAYLGRSAVIMGDHLRAGERFVVVDLFGAETDDSANRRENDGSYSTLTRARFEANYLALHDTLPEVIQGLSTEVTRHVEPGTARFVHVDASHLHAQVAEDIAAVRTLLAADGIVVFDDYRAEHTPGVAAAVWGAVATSGLVPFALTPYKLYATWGDPTRYVDLLRAHLADEPRMTSAEQVIAGHPVLRIKAAAKRAPVAPPAPAPVPAPASAVVPAVAPTRGRRRSDWLPPVVADRLRARRR